MKATRVREFLDRYEFLVLPVSQVAPFPVDVEWVREINGVTMNTCIDWMATCYAITLTGLPAISRAMRIHAGRIADRLADCRPPPSRSGRAQIGVRFRTSEAVRKEAAFTDNLRRAVIKTMSELFLAL